MYVPSTFTFILLCIMTSVISFCSKIANAIKHCFCCMFCKENQRIIVSRNERQVINKVHQVLATIVHSSMLKNKLDLEAIEQLSENGRSQMIQEVVRQYKASTQTADQKATLGIFFGLISEPQTTWL